ncbi:family 43 glycosylhydrolase [Confluentibacter sediminis]|uniref:family 43 glycosylhydrolase n=1 Tax=Confluentibacter sediminis TaxID=2219045 RepID=UPI000DAD01E9|nr:family 43 glycosylhydrolase [Confluentibacter sediminis]
MKHPMKGVMLLVFLTIIGTSCKESASENQSQSSDNSENFTVQITDNPLTFCNPINLVVGSERARRGGEPVVLIYKDDYYLFVTGSRGYWFSKNMRYWTYVDAPNFPGGVVSVINMNGTLYACAMNQKDVFSCSNPKSGEWTKAGSFDSDRYGDANMYYDDDGKLYMYYGWSQLMPFKVVELDPKTFKEIGEPKICFFGNYEEHGFERRRKDDVIFPFFNHRDYFPEEYPWIEGPWITKHKGKYYLQYASIGLEFLSYSHGVYVSDTPMGPFEYSQHNPLTFKTTGFAPGAGHGSTFHDKNGQLWTICMIPSFYNGRGGAEISLFPTAVDADGVMHSNTAFGDYPQYYPGVKKDAVDTNFTGWMLLSQKKKVEVSSTFEENKPANAVDENFMTFWSAGTGDPGEYMTVDLGKDANIYAIQTNFDQYGAEMPSGGGFGFGGGGGLDRYQSYTIEVSSDNKNWFMLIDKSHNIQDLRHDYVELQKPIKARYVKLTNVFTPSKGKFAVKDLRIFGNPDVATFTKVDAIMAVRNPEDRRDATLLWEPVKGADGYVVRYGIEPNKLYNNYMVYDTNTLTMHSLNKTPEYYFEVEAFDSGTDYYKERTEETMGRGAEIELSQGISIGYRGGTLLERKMTREGVNEYVFDSIKPDTYTVKHTFGPVLWSGKLTEAELIGSGDEPTVTAELTELGKGMDVTGEMNFKVIPGEKFGKIIITFD